MLNGWIRLRESADNVEPKGGAIHDKIGLFLRSCIASLAIAFSSPAIGQNVDFKNHCQLSPITDFHFCKRMIWVWSLNIDPLAAI